jgi:glycosyltransferase involved in cell wall biosynthesis
MQIQRPQISIVTPSYNMLPYLKLCCASITDQGVSLEHIVMDGRSTDGTAEWLKEQPLVKGFSEKDSGMYNALNKAIDKAQADIVGHLNCDEQYLPGVLSFVIQYFDEHQEIDFIAGNFLVIDPAGNLVAYRKSFQPRWPYFFSNYLYTTTCTLFYRRKIFTQCRFDESYRSIADVIFLYDVLKKRFRGVHIPKYFATFTYSGKNLSLNPISDQEKIRFGKTLPRWFKLFRLFFFFLFFVEKILNNTYFEKSKLSYAIYTRESAGERVNFVKEKPGFRLKFEATEPTTN